MRNDGLAVIAATDELMREVCMSWIAVLLIGVAVTDLAHSVRPVRILNECIGAASAVWVGLVAGLTEPSDVWPSA